MDVIKSHYLKGELFIIIIKKSINESPFLSGIFVSFPSVSGSRVAVMSAKWVGGSLVLSFLIVLKGLKKQASLDYKPNDINRISNNYLPSCQYYHFTFMTLLVPLFIRVFKVSSLATGHVPLWILTRCGYWWAPPRHVGQRPSFQCEGDWQNVIEKNKMNAFVWRDH